MSFLDEYKNLMSEETDDTQFPDEMLHDGLTENDREIYEQVLKNMREDMNKANEEMKKNSSSWGNVCEEVNGSIQNKTFKMDENMLREKMMNTYGGKMKLVSEPIGFMIETFRCPQCGRLMYEENGMFTCSNCGYSEESNAHMSFKLCDSTYTSLPIPQEYNNILVEIFRQSNKLNRKQ